MPTTSGDDYSYYDDAYADDDDDDEILSCLGQGRLGTRNKNIQAQLNNKYVTYSTYMYHTFNIPLQQQNNTICNHIHLHFIWDLFYELQLHKTPSAYHIHRYSLYSLF